MKVFLELLIKSLPEEQRAVARCQSDSIIEAPRKWDETLEDGGVFSVDATAGWTSTNLPPALAAVTPPRTRRRVAEL